jgi:retron-type reverse transcriptase
MAGLKIMKRYGNLYHQITDLENISRSHTQAKRGKSHYQEVRLIETDPNYYCSQIQHLLESHSFRTSPYTQKQVWEPKKRTIYKLPYFPDRIVHHAIMNIIQPIWDNVFIYDLYSAIPGKGLHDGSYRLRNFLNNHQNTRYCLKFDIEKYYPSINHDILIDLIKRKIKCPDTLWVLEEIIRSPGGTTNIPIGNYLSQYFGNIYLNWFDHWVKEDLKQAYYIRYCDDGVILGENKRDLTDIKDNVQEYLESRLELKLNKKTQIFEVDKTGIDFLGYRCFRSYVLLRKSSAARFKSKIKKIEDEHHVMQPDHIISSIMSYYGWIKHCDSYNLLNKYIISNQNLLDIVDAASSDMGIRNPLRRAIAKDCDAVI